MLLFACGFFVIFLSQTVLATGIHIWPDVPELTLTSGADLTLKCTGDFPVKWNHTQYDPNLNSEVSSTITISQGLENNSYISYLSLSRASYLDTGYYYCDPVSEDLETDEGISQNIYLYIQHDSHLLAVPEELVVLSQDEFGNVIIPCRPTSPDVNVSLTKDDEELVPGNMYDGMELHYDSKYGYLLYSVTMLSTGLYQCHAKYYNKESFASYHLLIMSKVDKVVMPIINSSTSSSEHLIVGQELYLNCSVSMDIGISFTLHWRVPDSQKIENGHVVIGKEKFFSGVKQGVTKSFGSRSLFIKNVTTEDEGKYTCEVTVHSGSKNSAAYTLKAYTPDVTYLDLVVQGGVFQIVRRAGFRRVQWIVQVSAYPKPTLIWRDPEGKEIGLNQDKIYVENDKITSKLVIKDLQLSDSGIYELTADNDAHRKHINVTLLVEDKPIVEIVNSTIFYEIDQVHIVECFIAGYPLPIVEWSFKECSNYPSCDESFIPITRQMYRETSMKETFLVSQVNITAKKTGILMCNASNDFGSTQHDTIFLVTDVTRGLSIKGPPVVVEGDNITVECGASKYMYAQNISWAFRSPSNNIELISSNKTQFITQNVTKHSYRSYLSLRQVNNISNGEFLCVISELVNFSVVQLSYPIKVNIAQAPVLYDSSNLNSSDWKVKTGNPVQWGCYVSGMPQPTIMWYKNNSPLRLKKNESRVLLLDKNQTLLIRFTALEDEGVYKCNASNRLGSVISTNTLTLIDKPVEHEHFGFIVVCAALAILVGVFMICFATHLKKERKLKKELAIAGLLHFENGAVESWNPDLGIEEQAELLPYDKRWEFPREKLKLGKQLGSGAFGIVYKAEAIGIIDDKTSTTVAVKMVKPNTDPSYVKALASELKIMIHLGRHLNVVNLLGAYTGNINKRELMVIVEYCRFGNIHDYLLKQRDCFVNQITLDGYLDFSIKNISKNPYYVNVPSKNNSHGKVDDSSTQIGSDGYLVPDEVEPEWRSNYRGDYKNLNVKPICTHDLICWSFQISRGMDYLASRKILHGDLATRNVLLAEDNIVKICDFGFAKTMYNSENYKKKSAKDLLPVKWMAIESLRDRVFSTQSDVWAFGIVLWEIFSLAVTPYPKIQQFEVLFNKLVEGYRMEQPEYANSDIYNIMLDCWKMNPLARPSFNNLAQRLGDLLEDSTKSHYMNLNEVYLRMNTEGAPSTDYLSMLTAPTYLNYTPVSENNSQNVSDHSETKDDFELKPMLENPECSGYVNITKPTSFSNPHYIVVDKSDKRPYLQSSHPSLV
ncbi:vascular endothelial growth factor receptor 1 isoform X2 [Daktulosphaira vitifoliae]|uniref:vascular endothelial growth factor receptor 1 isoform X2 n=1 Tax=Daktulosphaira vitifoliae TaxID=58002 RepID=UPI0021A979AD|nr:vascular endothelial growth factor receptor 1 isoform X2 [Daktulosphaira vitifoliae]